MPHIRSSIPQNPIALAGRALRKLVVERLRYGRGDDYAAKQYWTDRFSKHGGSLRGPGRDGLTEAENQAIYDMSAERFTRFCREAGISFAGKRVLEIGCGTGFYTRLIADLAPDAEYTGLDITDVQFPALRAEHPAATFIKADVTEPNLPVGTYDIVLMIDVVEHIVQEDRFRNAMANVRAHMAPGGTFVVAGVGTSDRKPLFYVRWWSLRWFEECFPNFTFSEAQSYSFEGQIVALTAPAAA